MKKVFVLMISCLITSQLLSQHLIGLSKDQVMVAMKKYYSSFSIDNTTVNNTYKYLKFSDNFSEQTMLVFLSEDDKCTATKLMSDFSNLEEIKAKLNKAYKPSGKDKWVYNVNGINYQVTLKRAEWYFTVFTNKKEK